MSTALQDDLARRYAVARGQVEHLRTLRDQLPTGEALARIERDLKSAENDAGRLEALLAE